VTDERATAQAAALVVLKTMPEWKRLPAERQAAFLERYADGVLRERMRAAAALDKTEAIGPSDGNSGGL